MSKTGQITQVTYECPELPDWAPLVSGVVMPVGTPICVAANWTNTGTESVKARVYLKSTDPGGAETWWDPDLHYAILNPGESTWIYFDNVTFETEGQYSIEVSLVEYDGGVLLDGLAVAVDGGYPETPPVDGEITPATLSLMTMILLLGMSAAMVGAAMKMVNSASKNQEGASKTR